MPNAGTNMRNARNAKFLKNLENSKKEANAKIQNFTKNYLNYFAKMNYTERQLGPVTKNVANRQQKYIRLLTDLRNMSSHQQGRRTLKNTMY